jgi:hypothetical protein
MPLTFFEAKAIVSPNAPVIPGSHDHKQILELMKQSGTHFHEATLNIKPVPLGRVRQLAELSPFRERKMEDTGPVAVSKDDWLRIDANRAAFKAHMESQPIQLPTSTTNMDLKGKTLTGEVRRGMSKAEFLALLK